MPYQPYRDVLAQSLGELGRRYGVDPAAEQPCGVRRVGAATGPRSRTPTRRSRACRRRYRLVPITNCDDDLFAGSAARLGVTFDDVVTAQQAGAYKPDERPFELAFERLGVPRERVLHVAQSLFHDHVTAQRLGLTSVWINRRAGRPGEGATPPAQAAPDLELPDMRSLADLLVG